MLLFAKPASIAAQLIISFHDISAELTTTFLLSTSSPVLSQLLPRLDLETAIRDVRPSSSQVFGSSNAQGSWQTLRSAGQQRSGSWWAQGAGSIKHARGCRLNGTVRRKKWRQLKKRTG